MSRKVYVTSDASQERHASPHIEYQSDNVIKIEFVKLWDSTLGTESNLEGFVWSHQSITGLISQRQFAP